jgi:hypothetical protein
MLSKGGKRRFEAIKKPVLAMPLGKSYAHFAKNRLKGNCSNSFLTKKNF